MGGSVEVKLRPLTDEEQAVAEALGEAWNLFTKLPITHDADAREFELAVHTAQRIVLARPAVKGWSR